MTLGTILLQAQGGSMMPMLLMLVALFAVMYFLQIRPQQKRNKEIQNFRKSMKPGTPVITAGGIYGRVRAIDEQKSIVSIEIAKGVVIEVDSNSVFASANDSAAAQANNGNDGYQK
jgi:preprotein translocase subunit YajC